MKEKATLFSFFTKLPQKKMTSPVTADDAGLKQSISPKESAKTSPKLKSETRPLQEKGTEDSKAKAAACKFSEFDVVWAKLDGYPWWPSLVCKHPTAQIFYKGVKRPEVHVQFFDETSSRAWLSARYAEKYEGSKARECQPGGRYFNQKAAIKESLREADKALKMTVEERKNLVVCIPSDDEEGEDEENMDVDDHNSESEEDEKPKRSTATRPKRATGSKTKRRRIADVPSDSESSGEEFKPGSDDDDAEESDGSSGVDEKDDMEPESDPETPKKAKKRKRGSQNTPQVDASGRKVRKVLATSSTPAKKVAADIFSPSRKPSTPSTPSTPVVSTATKSKLSTFQAIDVPSPAKVTDSEHENYPHNKLSWLQPDNLRDGKGRLKTDENYDPRTLKVPHTFLDKCTPAIRQWWDIKAKHFDTVLFFKMGKFYELFNMDAEVGVKELGLIYMKGENAHCGFPEIAFGRYSDTLIQKGYKVARIEQTETPEMMQERCRNMGRMANKFDKVVKREVCRVSSKGTRLYSFIDGDTCESQSSYLLAVAERSEVDSPGEESTYGVCFVDTSIGKFHIGQFRDDRHSSRFRTLISHHAPAQVLLERGKLSPKSNSILQNNLLSVLKEQLQPGTEFWNAQKTLKVLSDKNCFEDTLKTKESDEDNIQNWPSVIKRMVSEGDSLGLTPKSEYELALSALGACVWYLKECKMEQELLSMCSFEEYRPLDRQHVTMETDEPVFSKTRQHLVLDGISLSNLEILQNSLTGGQEGTLLERLDRCSTPFGRRLFRQWLCAPLCNPRSINDRLNAVEDLMENQDKVVEAIEILKKLPDLERFLSKIHSLGSLRKSEDHPDGRAIFFEDATYGKRKILDFLMTLEGFHNAQDILKVFGRAACNFKSKLLKRSLTLEREDGKGGRYPDLKTLLNLFENAFDKKKAKDAGAIIPRPGVDEEYDQAVDCIKATEKKFDVYLEKQRKRLGCSGIKYWGSGKNRYQLEVPEAALSRHTPEEYELQSSKKGFKRYWTSTITEMLAQLTDAEERRDAALKDSMRRVFHKFDEHYKLWDQAVQCLAVLDVLISMSNFSMGGEDVMCRPEFVEPTKDIKPFIAIQNGRHPCIIRTFSGGDYIPNNTCIGTPDVSMDAEGASNDNSCCVLVTGPNMGGKSTLMRQVGLIVITAQLGCFVPAESCKLTPVDRVFTRLGARDNIMSGESTFYVELSETSSILQHATRHSLILMDELGRGTATYDGTAIASAVVKELSENIGCRTLFSTHYHSLVEEFSHDVNIRLGHMACMVENENDEDPSQETITFLYKFVSGACPKSYGFNAARLADIPEEIIKLARSKAFQFEESANRLKLFRAAHKLMSRPPNHENFSQLKKLVLAS